MKHVRHHASIYSPEYDGFCAMYDRSTGTLIENRAARQDANLIWLLPRRETR